MIFSIYPDEIRDEVEEVDEVCKVFDEFPALPVRLSSLPL